MSPARIIILVVALAAGLGAALLAQGPSQGPAPVAKIQPAPTVPDILIGDPPVSAFRRQLTRAAGLRLTLPEG